MSRTQEMLVPTLASTDKRLERSSWKVEAIRRGDLKISGPLPIAEDAAGETAAIHLDPPVAPPVPSPPSQLERPKTPEDLEDDVQLHEDEQQRTTTVQIEPQALHSARQNPTIDRQPISDVHRHTMPDISGLREQNTSTPARSTTESPSDLNNKKKRQSGLKSVFKRMFSRRGKRDSKKPPEQRPALKHAYSQSDPGALTPTPKRASVRPQATQASMSTPERPSAPLLVEPRVLEPVHELHPHAPLRSHLPFPMNINAPDETPPSANRSTFEPEHPEIKRRRASLPSVVFNSAEVTALAAIWSQSGSEVTAADEQAFLSPLIDSEIGIALSSPTQSTRNHRKSRSAGALRELARSHAGHVVPPAQTVRRLSAEIRYWRQSEGARSLSVYSELPVGDAVRYSDDKVLPLKVESPVEKTAPKPPQMDGFNFGDLNARAPTKGKSRRSNSSARSEPTQQFARSRHGSQHHAVVLEEAPKEKRSSRQRSSSTVRENFSRPSSIREASAAAAAAQVEAQKTPTPPPPPPPSSTIITATRPAPSPPRPLEAPFPPRTSTDSIPYPSHPSSSPPSSLPSPTTQFHAIYTILRHERSARKALQSQVESLTHSLALLRTQLALLQHTSPPPQNPVNIYPTPSPDDNDPLPWHHDFAPPDPRRETAVSRFSKFTDDEEGAATTTTTTTTEDEDEDEGIHLPARPRARSAEEVWQTPMEEVAPELGGEGREGYYLEGSYGYNGWHQREVSPGAAMF